MMWLVASDPVAGGTLLVLLRMLMGISWLLIPGMRGCRCDMPCIRAMPPRRRGLTPWPWRRNEDNECPGGNCPKSRRIEATAVYRLPPGCEIPLCPSTRFRTRNMLRACQFWFPEPAAQGFSWFSYSAQLYAIYI